MAIALTVFDFQPVYQGISGGQQFSTTVVTVNSGFEQRNANWSQSRGKWELGNVLLNGTQTDELMDFFHSMMGRKKAFLFRDYANFKDNGRGVMLPSYFVEYADGSVEYKLSKRFVRSGEFIYKEITKPDVSKTFIFSGSTDITADFEIDESSGLVWTNTPSLNVSIATVSDVSGTMADITTSLPHGIVGDRRIFISGMPVGSALSGWFLASPTGETSLRVTCDVSGDPLYVSGGSLKAYRDLFDLTWTGEFYTPVRFDTDQLPITLEAVEYVNGSPAQGIANVWYRLGTITLLEVRE